MLSNDCVIEYVKGFTNISTSASVKSDCDKLIIREESRLLNAHAIMTTERQRERSLILSHRGHCYSKAGAFHEQDFERTTRSFAHSSSLAFSFSSFANDNKL